MFEIKSNQYIPRKGKSLPSGMPACATYYYVVNGKGQTINTKTLKPYKGNNMDMYAIHDKEFAEEFLKKVIAEYVAPTKPKFYQAKLVPIKDVMLHVYQSNSTTLESRMPKNATCPECGSNEWWLLPKESAAVTQGGKAYCECLICGEKTHL